jgi:nucleoside-specific outer membrane channel protein Tsx
MASGKLLLAWGMSGALAVSVSAAAGPLWQDNNLTLVTGGHFKVDPEARQTLTFEHPSGWSCGDLFVFVDGTRFNGNRGGTWYGEISPRFSLGKLSGRAPGNGLVRDVLLATTLELGKGEVETLLAGPALDLAIPGFDFFQLNLYRRFPLHDQDGETVQLTPVWAITRDRWRFDGFIDWNLNADAGYASNLHFNPQLKYDLGSSLGLGPRAFLVGLEYSYWKNKYGIRDSAAFRTDENALSLIVQTHF